MDFHIDPTASLADIQLACFMAAITALVELAKTTDKDHIKLRALTEVARLCNPSKPTLSPRRVGSTGFTPSPTSSMPSASSASPPSSPPHGTPSASAGPHAPLSAHPAAQPHAPAPVARAPRSEEPEFPTPSSSSRTSCSTPTLNRRQRRLLARLEANDHKRAPTQHIAA